MGWTSWHATYYKNGKIDKKREIDERWTQTEHDGYPRFTVLKSVIVGNTYYAAIEKEKKGVKEVFAAISYLSIDNNDYFNIASKDFDETVYPEARCPESILKLLTETEYENANLWRKECHEYNERRKTHDLKKIPYGTIIKTKIRGTDYRLMKMKPSYQFRTDWYQVLGTGKYLPKKLVNNSKWEIESEVAI